MLHGRDHLPAGAQTQRRRGLIQIGPTAGAGWLTGDATREPHGRKPRAMAISPAPNRLCYTAGITHLLEPKRSFLAGLIKKLGDCPRVFVKLAGLAEPLGVTSNHSIYSADRLDFVPAGELRVKETLRNLDGDVRIESIEQLGSKERFYNLELQITI
ncbi:MAG: hypothetical protein NTV29_11325 [Planctomycetota bacterium]|nr:hypothetical protein [Planctomycetota bacterium]